MAGVVDNLKRKLVELRRARPSVDHVIRTQEQYSAVQGSQQAGGVTYFAFLSFFPILALAFFAVSVVAKVYPDAQDQLVKAISQVLPEMISKTEEPGKISLDTMQKYAATAGWIGLAGALYSGLGWLSSMRTALYAVFNESPEAQPNFVIGKLRDLAALAAIGFVMIASVAVSSVVSGLSDSIVEWIGLDAELSWALKLLTVVVGLVASAVLFYAIFRLLAAPSVPTKALWSGALLGAVGFEILKRISGLLMSGTKESPALQAFGVALILLVWINYFSRLVLYAASWAYTSREARALRGESLEIPHPDQPGQEGRSDYEKVGSTVADQHPDHLGAESRASKHARLLAEAGPTQVADSSSSGTVRDFNSRPNNPKHALDD